MPTPQGNTFTTGQFRLPFDPKLASVSSRPGWRSLNNTSRMHWGTDFARTTLARAQNASVAIKASLEGRVVFNGTMTFFGNTVIIYHGTDAQGRHIYSLYGHMAQPGSVPLNSLVATGQQIGVMGNTGGGNSTGIHLHQELFYTTSPLPTSGTGQVLLPAGPGGKGFDRNVLKTIDPFSKPQGFPDQDWFYMDDVRLLGAVPEKNAPIDPRRPYGSGEDEGITYEQISYVQFVDRVMQGTYVAAELGSILGSSLGRYLGGDNFVGQIAGATLLDVVGRTLLADIYWNASGAAARLDQGLFNEVAGTVGVNLANAFQGAAIGTASSFLTAELGRALGVEGFGAELLDASAGTLISKALANASTPGVGLWDGFSFGDLFEGDLATGGGALASALGAFLGAKLGSLVVSPTTTAGAVLSTLGSAAGGWLTGAGASASGVTIGANVAGALGLKSGTLLFNIVAPGVGAFIGFVLGALAGNLFGRKHRPRVPNATAETYLQIPFANYEVGDFTAQNGGNVELATNMAVTARDTLNLLIAEVTGGVERTVTNTVSPTQIYGHNGQQVYVKLGGSFATPTNVNSPDEAVDKGVLYAIANTKIIGGNILQKRAIYRSTTTLASQTTNLVRLLGNMQVASDYEFYRLNHEAVDGALSAGFRSLSTADQQYYQANRAFLIRVFAKDITPLNAADAQKLAQDAAVVGRITAALSVSEFSAAWLVTLQRASELGVDDWAPSDFYGGLHGFIDSFNHAGNYESLTLGWDSAANGLTITADTRFPEQVFRVLPQSSADGRSITIGGFASTMGYQYAAGTAGNDVYLLDLTLTPVTISFGTGDDIAYGGYADDWMHGNQGDDWLDGNNGNDTLLGGAGDDVLLGRVGDDLLTGDAGNDYAYGGSGNDDVRGGEGDDTLGGGAGSDTLTGGNGQDVLLADFNDGALDRLDGGVGQDIVSYERFSSAISIDLRNVQGDGSVLAYGDVLISVEGVRGTAYNDVITAGAAAALLQGGDGDDTLTGWTGDDVLEGGRGADRLNGGSGIDTASYQGSWDGVSVDLTTGVGEGGDATGDTYVSIENIRGSRFSDVLRGDANANYLWGGAGDDWLIATAGADVYDGGSGFDFVDYSNASAGVTLNLGSSLATAPSNGSGSGGLAAGHVYISIEGVIGSNYADQLYGGAGDQVFSGGGGNDFMSGGQGSDTYIFGVGGGYDTVVDDNTAANTLSLTAVTYSDLFFGSGGSPSTPDLYVTIIGTGETITVSTNFRFDANRNIMKFLNLDGTGEIDISMIDYGLGGTVGNDVLNGTAAHYDWLTGYQGNDVLRGAWNGSSDVTESRGNLIIGGQGDDTITTSFGDDQFVFERGHGRDVVTDTGGVDVIVFGPSVAEDDVIYEIVGHDLYVGLRDAANPSLKASQVADHMRFINGGTKYTDLSYGGDSFFYTPEHINVGGASINLLKLDLNWYQEYWVSGPIAPLVLDLDGDGLDAASVTDSDIVVRGQDGKVFSVGWFGPTEGILAVDRNGDGKIDRVSEISFTQDKPGAKSDLEGLTAWDSNSDGVLDAKDERFGELLIWIDADQNGQSSPKELRTLKEAGISSISLKGEATGVTQADTFETFAQSTFRATKSDGSTIAGFDVVLGSMDFGAEGFSRSKLEGDGVFGSLLNDAKKKAKEAAGGRPVTPADVMKHAELDFTGGRVNGKGVDRWSKKPGQKPGGGWEHLATVEALRKGGPPKIGSSGAPVMLSGAALGPSEAFEGAVDLAPTYTAEDAETSLSRAAGATFRPASAEPDLASAFADWTADQAGASEGLDWWRGRATTDLQADDTLVGLAGAASSAGWPDSAIARPAADPSKGGTIDPLNRDLLLLQQAVAGFGGDIGGTAAVWRRRGEDDLQAALAPADRLPHRKAA